MGTVSTRIEEGDGFKVLRYGLGSIVLIIGYPQSESDLIDAEMPSPNSSITKSA